MAYSNEKTDAVLSRLARQIARTLLEKVDEELGADGAEYRRLGELGRKLQAKRPEATIREKRYKITIELAPAEVDRLITVGKIMAGLSRQQNRVGYEGAMGVMHTEQGRRLRADPMREPGHILGIEKAEDTECPKCHHAKGDHDGTEESNTPDGGCQVEGCACPILYDFSRGREVGTGTSPRGIPDTRATEEALK